MTTASKIFRSCTMLALIAFSSFHCADRGGDNPSDTGTLIKTPVITSVLPLADTAVVITWTAPDSRVTGYEIGRKVEAGEWVHVATVPGTVLQFTDQTLLTLGQISFYRVRALTDGTASEYVISSPMSITFRDPTGVTVIAEGDTAMMVGWTYAGSYQTGFEVERLETNEHWTTIGSVAPDARHYRDAFPVIAGRSYAYRVRARSRNNVSSFALSPPLNASLQPPIRLTLTALMPGDVRLVWVDMSTIEAHFEVESSTDGVTFTRIAVCPAGSEEGIFPATHTPGQRYWFRVRAAGKTILGDPSGSVHSEIPPGMVPIVGGTFSMGSNDNGYRDEQPQHTVTLKGFLLDATEVTVAQYEEYLQATMGSLKGSPPWGWWRNDPIVLVTWDDAAAYAHWAGKRLPTEAEWEYAARGGSLGQGYAYSGSNAIGDVAWYAANAGNRTRTVGTKKPNELGLYDMNGNVWEWCADWYSETWYAVSPVLDPAGPGTGIHRVLRGGSWQDDALPVFRVPYRIHTYPTDFSWTFGFRCAADF